VTNQIGFIGGGNMAGSLIGGLAESVRSKDSSLDISNWAVFEPNNERALELKKNHGISVAANNNDLVSNSNVIVLAVKPQVLENVLVPLKESINQSKPLIISIVAGIRSTSIEKWLGTEHGIVRVMPNTPALIGSGASGLFANNHVTESQRSFTENLMSRSGVCVWVKDEEDIDTVTALSGSGPAYFMLFIQSLIDSAISAGLDESSAKTLATATAAGAAKLIDSSDESIATLIDNVTSPGGTTEKALASFEESNLADIVQSAFEAAKQRSVTLADELGTK